MASNGNLPDFLCIGAEKAGTSWLDKNLRHHPDIWMPPLKELLYFYEIAVLKDTSLKARLTSGHWIYREWRRLCKNNVRVSFAIKQSSEFMWWLKYLFGPRNDKWYVSLFRGGEGKVKGEITPTYSRLDDKGVQHVHRLLPDAGIIFIMRNPIERAWSHAVMNLASHTGRQLSDVSDHELYAHFNGEDSRKSGGYVATLDAWEKYYPAERMLIGFLDDIGADPGGFLMRIFHFLGVSEDGRYIPSSVGQKVFEGRTSVIPDRFAVYLSKIYYDDLCRLEHRFGAHVSKWREQAQTVAAKRGMVGPDHAGLSACRQCELK